MRFVHTGDIHLGASPDQGFPWASERGGELWKSFESLIARIRKEKQDLLLIAGDLFHSPPSIKELREVNYLFSTIPHTTVVLIAGNHDHLQRKSPWMRIDWENNVVGLWKEEIEKIYIEKLNCWIYGSSFHRQKMETPLSPKLRAGQEKGFHILLVHGGDQGHRPMDFGELKRAGFSYVALGHIHKPTEVDKDHIWYCGSLEPLDKTEAGLHGYVEGEIDRGYCRTEFVPWAKRAYKDIVVTRRQKTSQFELEEMIEREISCKGQEHMYMVRILGDRIGCQDLDRKRLYRLGRIVELVDATKASYDLEELKEIYRDSLVSDVIDSLSEREDETGRRALELALAALLPEEDL